MVGLLPPQQLELSAFISLAQKYNMREKQQGKGEKSKEERKEDPCQSAAQASRFHSSLDTIPICFKSHEAERRCCREIMEHMFVRRSENMISVIASGFTNLLVLNTPIFIEDICTICMCLSPAISNLLEDSS